MRNNTQAWKEGEKVCARDTCTMHSSQEAWRKDHRFEIDE